MSDETPLTAARRRDVERRKHRVRKALADMHNDGSDITVAATAACAGVHRSFIHRHPELRARLDERDDELAAAREANRSLMAELNRACGSRVGPRVVGN